jgi:hypothetical protein
VQGEFPTLGPRRRKGCPATFRNAVRGRRRARVRLSDLSGVGNLPPGKSGPRITSECATTRPESSDPPGTDERRNPGCHMYELRVIRPVDCEP